MGRREEEKKRGRRGGKVGRWARRERWHEQTSKRGNEGQATRHQPHDLGHPTMYTHVEVTF
jgi:hypothetical protein